MYLPHFSCFNAEYMLQVLAGKKKLLSIDSPSNVELPNYQLTNKLSKAVLLDHCYSSIAIRQYLPETTNRTSISRDFLFRVSGVYLLYIVAVLS